MKAVLFDFDGTLYNLELELDGFKRRWARAGGSVGAILRTLAGDELQEALNELETAEMEGVQRGRPVAGAAEAFGWVAEHYPVAVVSSNGRAAVVAGLAAMGISSVTIISRESTATSKPAADPIHMALGQLDATSGVMVGDSSHDVAAASAAGIISVITHNPKLEFTPEKANYYVNSIREIPGLIEEIM